jgi:hypothetical protein
MRARWHAGRGRQRTTALILLFVSVQFIWIVLAWGRFAAKTLIYRYWIFLISLDSLVRIQTYQWVTRDFREKNFSRRFSAPWAFEKQERKGSRRGCAEAQNTHRANLT